MSTEHQQYSIANQSAALALYAAAHGMGIVRSYVDAGKSGVTLAGRNALKNLIRTVESRQADFSVVLVYDVSRWGRFQDVDEAAHYEFICKQAGVQIRYCAEQFENDNSPASNLLKALKRMMAGEYSRELSAKVYAGQCRLASMGYWQGGLAPYAHATRRNQNIPMESPGGGTGLFNSTVQQAQSALPWMENRSSLKLETLFSVVRDYKGRKLPKPMTIWPEA